MGVHKFKKRNLSKINLNQISEKDLIDHAAISDAFKKYLMDVLDYSEDEANFVASTDFANPYNTPFIVQDYKGNYIIDGCEYEVRTCSTNFCIVGLYHLADVTPFKFYMFFDLKTLPDQTVGSYQSARKMYLI